MIALGSILTPRPVIYWGSFRGEGTAIFAPKNTLLQYFVQNSLLIFTSGNKGVQFSSKSIIAVHRNKCNMLQYRLQGYEKIYFSRLTFSAEINYCIFFAENK